jgi:hypothetical protein
LHVKSKEETLKEIFDDIGGLTMPIVYNTFVELSVVATLAKSSQSEGFSVAEYAETFFVCFGTSIKGYG